MTFWIFAILLVLFTLAFLLPPLLRKPTDIMDDRRDQNISITKQQLAELEANHKKGELEEETYLQAKTELEDALLSDLDAEDTSSSATSEAASKLPVILVGLFVPVLAIGLYLILGNPQGIAESSVDLSKPAAKPEMSMDKVLVKLEEKLKEDPNNHMGWLMLGRSYMATERPAKAVKAYEKAIALKPDDPTTLLQMADALATSKQGDLQGRPEQLILQALKHDPENIMGLWLAGMSAQQRGSNPEAIAFWNKVIPKLAPDSEERNEVLQLIAKAGGKADTPAVATAAVPATTETQQAPATAGISVKIDIAEALKAKTSPEQVLFIYAKAVNGSPMPLAAVRKLVKDLPVTVMLDDSMAMTPQGKISSFKEVTVGARVSVSGTPTKSPGDLFTEQSPVKLGQSITLTIDQVVK